MVRFISLKTAYARNRAYNCAFVNRSVNDNIWTYLETQAPVILKTCVLMCYLFGIFQGVHGQGQWQRGGSAEARLADGAGDAGGGEARGRRHRQPRRLLPLGAGDGRAHGRQEPGRHVRGALHGRGHQAAVGSHRILHQQYTIHSSILGSLVRQVQFADAIGVCPPFAFP